MRVRWSSIMFLAWRLRTFWSDVCRPKFSNWDLLRVFITLECWSDSDTSGERSSRYCHKTSDCGCWHVVCQINADTHTRQYYCPVCTVYLTMKTRCTTESMMYESFSQVNFAVCLHTQYTWHDYPSNTRQVPGTLCYSNASFLSTLFCSLCLLCVEIYPAIPYSISFCSLPNVMISNLTNKVLRAFFGLRTLDNTSLSSIM